MPEDTGANRRTKTYSFQELRQLTFPPESLIIGNGLLKKNSVMCIGAPPKSLKSFTLNTIMLQLLIGGHLFGVHRTHARQTEHMFTVSPVNRVLLFEQEIGLEDTQERMLSLLANLSPAERAILDERLFIHSCDYDLRLDNTTGINKIRTIIHEVKPDVVCFDPLAKFHTSEENSPSEMGRIVLNYRMLITEFDISIILLHHTGKHEEGKQGLDHLRGASSFPADIDTGMILHVTNRNASVVWVEPVIRRGKPISNFELKLNHETLRMEFHKWCKGGETYQQERTLTEIKALTDKEQ